MSEETDMGAVEAALLGLVGIEEEMEQAERAAEIARLKSVTKIYQKRSEHLQKLEKFWHIVLSEHPEFAEYIRAQDFKYLETIRDIYVSWPVVEDAEADPSDFSITFKFDGTEDGDFRAQTVTKRFWIEKIDPEELSKLQKKKRTEMEDSGDEGEEQAEENERLVSEKVEIEWPSSYDSINPDKIEDKKSAQGKKNYRAGMKSFFGWFRWTGRKPGKEFPNGDDFARLFAEEIFTDAVKYYTEAQRDGLEEELDSDASEPLDLSDTEERDTKKQKLE